MTHKWRSWEGLSRKPHFTTAMSTIWRVKRAASPGQIFALKELRYPKGPGSAAFRRFKREIETLRVLSSSNPGIVEVVDAHIPDTPGVDPPFYVMPLAETSLLKEARALKGQLEAVLRIGLKIASTLEPVHAAGVVHRDIKPANILMFGEEREPRVADFGICFLEEEDRITRAEAQTVGTDDYVAPELRGGGQSENVTPAADIYSLGKTMYAVASGGTVLPREWLDDPRYNLVKLFDDHRFEHLDGLLRRMITERPDLRYQSMAESRAHFDQAIENLRDGVRFHPRMYGGSQSPAERANRLARQLETLTGHRLADVKQDAIRDSIQSARNVAQAIESTPNAMSGPALQPRPAALEVARKSAEELLSVGVPLVANGDNDGLEDWLAVLTDMVRTREDAANQSDRWIIPAAATFAIHAAGALAWHRQRYEILRRIIDAQLETPNRWIHHYILGESSSAVIPWALRDLPNCDLMARADEALIGELEQSVAAVAGLVILRCLITMRPSDLETELNENPLNIPTDAFPGYSFPAIRWTSDFPRAFRASPRLERSVAQVILDVSPVDLRSHCARITPAIARSATVLAHEERRMIHWGMGSVGYGWAEWCGLTAG